MNASVSKQTGRLLRRRKPHFSDYGEEQDRIATLHSVVTITMPAAVGGEIMVAAARGRRGGAAGAVVNLAFAVRRLAAAAAVERGLVAARSGGLELAVEYDGAVGGLAGAVRRLGLAAAAFSTLLLVAVAEPAAHHVDASELGAHVLGWLCGGGRSVSLGGGDGSGRAAGGAAVVVVGLWDCEIVSFSCFWIWTWIWMVCMFLLLKEKRKASQGRERLTGLAMARRLLLPPLALALRSRPGRGPGFLHVGLARRLVVGGVAVHVGLLQAGVVAGLDLGDEVGVHGCLFGCSWVVWEWECWVSKRWMVDGGRMEGWKRCLGGYCL